MNHACGYGSYVPSNSAAQVCTVDHASPLGYLQCCTDVWAGLGLGRFDEGTLDSNRFFVGLHLSHSMILFFFLWVSYIYMSDNSISVVIFSCFPFIPWPGGMYTQTKYRILQCIRCIKAWLAIAEVILHSFVIFVFYNLHKPRAIQPLPWRRYDAIIPRVLLPFLIH